MELQATAPVSSLASSLTADVQAAQTLTVLQGTYCIARFHKATAMPGPVGFYTCGLRLGQSSSRKLFVLTPLIRDSCELTPSVGLVACSLLGLLFGPLGRGCPCCSEACSRILWAIPLSKPTSGVATESQKVTSGALAGVPPSLNAMWGLALGHRICDGCLSSPSNA